MPIEIVTSSKIKYQRSEYMIMLNWMLKVFRDGIKSKGKLSASFVLLAVLSVNITTASSFQGAIDNAAKTGDKLVLNHSSNEKQPQTINGTVTDSETEESLPGVNVMVKGTNTGTSTDSEGAFELNVSSLQDTLVFSFIGYQTSEIPISGRTEINLSLQPQTISGEEMVVVGYGAQNEATVTGSISSINADEITRSPAANTMEAIQGKIAGVDITTNERPGESGGILIRGNRSLNASNSPLYVVDGVPLSTGGIDLINPDDIASIDVLKDASATAVYGSRGANGVIEITTKQGDFDSFSLNFNSDLTFERLNDRQEMMNAAEYIKFRRDAYRRVDEYPEEPTLEDDARIFGGDAYAWENVRSGWSNGSFDASNVSTTDWTQHALKTGVSQNHTISASGGTENLRAYGSFGFLDEDGTQHGQSYQRYNTNLNVEITPVDWFRMGGNITGSYGDQKYGPSYYSELRNMLPYAVPFDSEGNRINLPGGDINIMNPVNEDEYRINNRETYRILGSIFAEVNILDNLEYRMNFGPEYRNWTNGRYEDEMSINRGAGEPGATNYAQYNSDVRRSWTLDNLIYYTESFQDHVIDLTLLQSATSYHQEGSSMTASDLPWDSQRWHQMNSVSSLDGYSTGLTESSLTSYMGRVNYSFDDKYLLTASARWDGASQLAEGQKWDFFPSAAISWRVSQEDFMQGQGLVDELKIRFSVGTTGNASIDPYTTKGAVRSVYYPWGSTVADGTLPSDPSLSDPISMANEELGWERTTQYNIGIDYGLLGERITGSIDLYTSRTNDLLLSRSIPSLTGYTSTLDNVGTTANKGVDLTLNTTNVETSDFSWSTGLTFSANRSRIVELATGEEDDLSNLWFIGERLNVYYDYEKDRIWQDTPEDLAEMERFNANGHSFRPGDIKPKDLNGDYTIDASNDRRIRGHSQPDWTVGFNNELFYKNWSLSFFLYSRWGFTIPGGEEFLQGRYAQRKVDYWTPDNPTNAYPAPNYNSAAGDPYKSSMNYQDGSFIKVRNVSLGYTLPASLTSNLNVSNIRLYTQLKNPGLLYSGVGWMDPDTQSSTFNRSLVFGVDLNL